MYLDAGYEDPVLLVAAQASGAGYQMRPWEYTPALSLTYSSALYPVEYLGNGMCMHLILNEFYSMRCYLSSLLQYLEPT